MDSPFLGDIEIFAFDWTPRGYFQCNGALISIAQNSALFALLGTYYGGNGTTTFAVPDFRGRVPISQSNTHVMGERTGEEFHSLNISEMPAHTHPIRASAATVTQSSPAGNLWAKGDGESAFGSTANASMHPASIGSAGINQGHENRMPFLVLNFCIASIGIFPSRN